MAASSSIESTWREREALRAELENARRGITSGARAVKDSFNLGARAKAFASQRPVATAVASVAAGAVMTRLIPVLIRRRKGLLGRFTTEVAKGMAGMALPFLVNRISRISRVPAPAVPRSLPLELTSTPKHDMTSLKIKGSWNEIKGKLKQKYAQITDNDLLFEEGKENKLLGRLQQKTGETKEALRDLIAKI